jgi:hypothetical protein
VTTASRTSPRRAGGSGQNGNAINIPRRQRHGARQPHQGRGVGPARQRRPDPQNLGQYLHGPARSRSMPEFGFEGAMIANNVVDGAALAWP